MGREDRLRPHVLAIFPYLMDKEQVLSLSVIRF